MTLSVVLGSDFAVGRLTDGLPPGHGRLIGLSVAITGMILLFLAAHRVARATGRHRAAAKNYWQIDVTPLFISLPGLLLPIAVSLAHGMLNEGPLGLNAVLWAVVMIFAMQMLINGRLGPLIERRSPGYWREILRSQQSEGTPIVATVATIVVLLATTIALLYLVD